jgi:predicted nucleotidyltransferase
MSRSRAYGPYPSVRNPRRVLLAAVREFVQAASACPSVRRIALVGSLATEKAAPKDADVLVTIDGGMDLAALARAGRRLKSRAQSINLGADIFLTDEMGRYLGRICRYRECHPRALCHARHCGSRQHLNDDLDVVTLSQVLITAPALDLWPSVLRRCAVPPDVEAELLAELVSCGPQQEQPG